MLSRDEKYVLVVLCLGTALMGLGTATGKNRAVEAATKALTSPLLNSVALTKVRT